MERVGIMAGMGKFDCKGMKELQKELDKLQKETDALMEACAKELAARLLAKVIKRTPVGDYPKSSGKKGGTLRRGWTAQNSGKDSEGSKNNRAKQYAESLEVKHIGNMYMIDIINPVEYASYVEYGHRTVNHKGWVPGRFMLKISEQELRNIAPAVLESRIKKFLKGAFK